MVQINLLPDVKGKYIKAQKTKRTVIISSVLVIGISFGVVLLLVSIVYGAQKVALNSLEKSVKEKNQQLQKVENLNGILTVQNQLSVLTKLHDEKPVANRIFTYLPQVTPSDVQIATIVINFDENTISITGSGKDLLVINKFVDTLKFTEYTIGESTDRKRAFSEVTLSSFGRTEREASYVITLKYDPELFSGTVESPKLVVPKITTTRSETERPNALFKQIEAVPTTTTQQGATQ